MKKLIMTDGKGSVIEGEVVNDAVRGERRRHLFIVITKVERKKKWTAYCPQCGRHREYGTLCPDCQCQWALKDDQIQCGAMCCGPFGPSNDWPRLGQLHVESVPGEFFDWDLVRRHKPERRYRTAKGLKRALIRLAQKHARERRLELEQRGIIVPKIV